jgi:hypothetical protein
MAGIGTIAYRLLLVGLVLSTTLRAIAPLDASDRNSAKHSAHRGELKMARGNGQTPFCFGSDSRLLSKLCRPDRTKSVKLGLHLQLLPGNMLLALGRTPRHAANFAWHDSTLGTLQTEYVRLQV